MTASCLHTTLWGPCVCLTYTASLGLRNGSVLGSTGFSLCSVRFRRAPGSPLPNLGPSSRFQSLWRVSTQEYLLRKLQHSGTFCAKSFRFRSYEKCACKPFRIRSYKNTGLKVARFHTLTKNVGGRGPSPESGLRCPGNTGARQNNGTYARSG